MKYSLIYTITQDVISYPVLYMSEHFTVVLIYELTSFFILWLYSQIHRAEDRYMVKQELKRLSFCVFVIIFSFTMWIVKLSWLDSYGWYNKDTLDIHVVTYSADIVFIFSTVYFQTKWVIQRTIDYKNGLNRNRISKQQSTSVTASASSKNKEFRMVDVMRSKAGFKAFIKHCVKELNVEGLVKSMLSYLDYMYSLFHPLSICKQLFLVEISQFKATLHEYDVGEILKDYNIELRSHSVVPNMSIQITRCKLPDSNHEIQSFVFSDSQCF